VRRRICQLPICDTLHDVENGLRRDVGGICLGAQLKINGEKKNCRDEINLARQNGFHEKENCRQSPVEAIE
jgi:hypothetical protein